MPAHYSSSSTTKSYDLRATLYDVAEIRAKGSVTLAVITANTNKLPIPLGFTSYKKTGNLSKSLDEKKLGAFSFNSPDINSVLTLASIYTLDKTYNIIDNTVVTKNTAETIRHLHMPQTRYYLSEKRAHLILTGVNLIQ